jgi:hypothetical protein
MLHRHDPKLLGLAFIDVKAPSNGIDILPPNAVQLAHAEARVDQYTDHVTGVFGEDLEQGGDDVVGERLRYIFVLLVCLKRQGGVFSQIVETMGFFEDLLYRT